MRLYLRCVVVLIYLLVPTTALASDHVASLFGAFSFLTGSTLKGGHSTLEISWPRPDRVHDRLGIVVDMAVYGGQNDASETVTKSTLMGGLRGIYRRGGTARPVLFAHALVGGYRSQAGVAADHGFAVSAGGGFDVLIGDTAVAGWALRNQYDWVRVAGTNSFRGSLGFLYRFKHP
jgi:hypothetical protein